MPSHIAFEKWAENQGGNTDKGYNGLYSDPFVGALYMSWCACRESCASLCDSVADVCKDSADGCVSDAGINTAKACAKLIRGNNGA